MRSRIWRRLDGEEQDGIMEEGKQKLNVHGSRKPQSDSEC